ncbi:MAG TPA: thioesterase domain-containing protein [Actinocrinis sp.]|nr:thioesterase domain-containing protein [Actinocrinis sp.]
MTTTQHLGSPAVESVGSVDSVALCAIPFRAVDRPVLHYIHEISGSVFHFAAVADRLAAHRTVIGLQSAGLNPGVEPDRTIEQMADRYLAVIEQRGDPEPYDIVGYSMGGLVAYEMATRLARAGREVRLLGLIDPPPPGTPDPIDTARVVRMLARTLQIDLTATSQSTVAGVGLDPDPDELVRLLIEGGRASGALPADYTIEDLQPVLDLQLANGGAAVAYRPAHIFPGDIRLLGAGPGVLAVKTRGWQPFAAGRILGDEVATDHFSLMQGRSAGEVADILERWVTGPQA